MDQDEGSAGWHSRFITSADGLTLHVAMMGPGDAPLPPVICLPGLTRNVEDFTIIGQRLAKAGRQVIALDSRGRGRSDYDADWRKYNLTIELQDVMTMLDTLGVERGIFLGTSRGGLLTALVAMMRPKALHAAILNDVGPVLEPEGIRRIQGYVGKIAAPASFEEGAASLKSLFASQFPLEDAASWLRYAKRNWKDENGTLVPRHDVNLMHGFAMLDTSKPAPDLWPQFAGLKAAPLLVIRGELSDLLSQETAELMVERHGKAQLHIAKQQGHAPLLEDEPTIAAILDFVAAG